MKKCIKATTKKLPERYNREEWSTVLLDWDLLRGVRSFLMLDNNGRVSVKPSPENYPFRVLETLDKIEYLHHIGGGILFRLLGRYVKVCKICNMVSVVELPTDSLCDCV